MSNLTLWTRRDPFAEFDTLVRRAFGPQQAWPTSASAGFTPAAEIDRDGDDAVVRLELPGLDVANDVVVEVDRGRLIVRGERRDERAEERAGRSLREVRYGSFQRSFRLPGHVTAAAVSAEYDAGVLSVRIAGVYAGGEAQRIAVTSTAAQEPTTGEAPAIEA
ncbi:MAG: Hsp20/alpha crystallin family protein [Hamadaea sp.]|nr:Hsp20/alpha crystallin family protein [Hamadaea sp.]